MSEIGPNLSLILDNYIDIVPGDFSFENNTQLRALENPMQRKLAFIYGILNVAEEGLLGGDMEKLDSFLNTLNQYANQPDGDLKVANSILSIIRSELTNVLHDSSDLGEEITRGNISHFYEYIKGGLVELCLQMSLLQFSPRWPGIEYEELSRHHGQNISSDINYLTQRVEMLKENLTRDLHEPTELSIHQPNPSYGEGPRMVSKVQQKKEILKYQKGPFLQVLSNPDISPEQREYYETNIARIANEEINIEENIKERIEEIQRITNQIEEIQGLRGFFGTGRGGYKKRNKSKKILHNKKHKTRNKRKGKNKNKSKSRKY